jgi:hypothetical protein
VGSTESAPPPGSAGPLVGVSRPTAGWPVIWVYSALLALRQEHRRRERLARAIQAIEDFNSKLLGPRTRRRSRPEVQARIEEILREHLVARYLVVELHRDEEHRFQQARRGRPGPDTRYVRKTRKFWRLRWRIDEAHIAYDRKSDGMYPLLTNDRSLTDAQVLEAHKRSRPSRSASHRPRSYSKSHRCC